MHIGSRSRTAIGVALIAFLSACGGGGSGGGNVDKPPSYSSSCADGSSRTSAVSQADARAQCSATVPTISGLVIGDLLWRDDFAGAAGATIDAKNWTARNCHRVPESLGGGACFGPEVVYYAPSAIALNGTDDGAAVITTTRVTGALPSDAGNCLSDNCYFVSGRFDTHGKVAFKYGFIEARIKNALWQRQPPGFLDAG